MKDSGFIQISKVKAYSLAINAINGVDLHRKLDIQRLEKLQREYWSKPTGLMWVLRWGKPYNEKETVKRVELAFNVLEIVY